MLTSARGFRSKGMRYVPVRLLRWIRNGRIWRQGLKGIRYMEMANYSLPRSNLPHTTATYSLKDGVFGDIGAFASSFSMMCEKGADGGAGSRSASKAIY